jgi:cytochrome d ubiquinol oxidase subunit II
VARQDPIQPVSAVVAALAVVAMFVATVTNARSASRAFVATSLAIVAFFSALFIDLFPNTMVSSTSSAFDMTLNFSSSSDYTLTVMTVVAALLVPVVLAYQAWTYWVFRRRLSAEDFGDVKSPLDLLDERNREGGDGADPDSGSRQQPASP